VFANKSEELPCSHEIQVFIDNHTNQANLMIYHLKGVNMTGWDKFVGGNLRAQLSGVSLRALGAGIALIVFGQPSVVVAQTATQAVPTQEVIIVTARKREERLQDVPLPITAFSAQAISDRGLTSIADIATQTPGFSFRSGFGRTFDRPVIRGMATIQGGSNAAFFLDGVFITGSAAGYGLDTLARVEVIRGPQSALFGRSTFAGAINFITRKPTNTPHGKATMTLGADGLLDVSGFYSGALVADKLFFEVNARGYSFDGQYTNEADPGNNLGAESTSSYGGVLVWQPTSNIELSYRLAEIKDQDGAPPLALIGRTPGQNFPLAPGVLQTNGQNCFQPQLTGALNLGRPETSTRRRGYWCGEVPVPTSFAMNTGEFAAAGFPYAIDREITRQTFKAKIGFGDWELGGYYAKNSRTQKGFTDQDYSSLRTAGFETFDFSGSDDESYDIRLASPSDWKIRGQAGYFSYKDQDIADGYSGNLRIPIATGSATLRPFERSDQASLLSRGAVAPGNTENTAWYAQIEVNFTDRLKASAEVRSQTDTVAISGASTATVGTTVFSRSLNVASEFTSVLPRYTVDFKLTPDVLVYGVAAKGNKPGGINSGAYNAIYTDAQVAEFESLGLAFVKEEEIWSYEVGAKTSWLDKRLVLNASAYMIDWTNQQLTQTLAVQPAGRRDGILGSLSFTTNIGASEIRGLELESVFRPNSNWEFRAGYALQATKIINFIATDQADLFITAADIAALNLAAPPAPAGSTPAQIAAATAARITAGNALIALRGNAAGNELPRTPKHQVQLGAAYFHTFAGGWETSLRADYTYESKRYIQVDNLGWSQPLNLLNLRASAEKGPFTFSAFVNNALDGDTQVDILRSIDTQQTVRGPLVTGFGLGSISIRDFLVTMPRKRSVGVTLSVGF
jgi:iron complex outermembrane recepter protein